MESYIAAAIIQGSMSHDKTAAMVTDLHLTMLSSATPYTHTGSVITDVPVAASRFKTVFI